MKEKLDIFSIAEKPQNHTLEDRAEALRIFGDTVKGTLTTLAEKKIAIMVKEENEKNLLKNPEKPN